MQVPSPTSRRKRTPTGKVAIVVNHHLSSPGTITFEREAAIVESSCDETLSLGATAIVPGWTMPGMKQEDGPHSSLAVSGPGTTMPGMKQGDPSSLSHSPLSQSSVPPPAWSTTSAPPNNVLARSSPPPPPTDMSPQSSTVEAVQQQQHNPNPNPNPFQYSNLQDLKSEERGLYLIQLLLSCATAVANGNMEHTNLCLEQLSLLASLTGDSMQRVASYFMEGLAARITRSWPGVFKALHTTQYPSMVEVLSARQVFFNVCPYLKFAFLTINQSILDSMEGEKVLHIVDLQAVDAVQWLALLQALRARPGGPPHLKITGISEKKNHLENLGKLLTDEAERLAISFQFVPVIARLDDVDVDALNVKIGEAVAVSSVMRLHFLLNEEEQKQHQASSGNGGVPNSDIVGSVDPEEVPKGQVVNGVLNGSKERCVFRSIGGGAFERVENGEQKLDGPSEERDRGLKRSRDPSDGDDPRQKHSPRTDRGGGSVVSQGNNNATHAGQHQHGESGERSEHLDKERKTSLTGTRQGLAMDKVLRMLKILAPKVMVVVEQESNHNSPLLVERFVEALHYYCALFDSLDSTLPLHCLERVTLEKQLFGVEIKNVVACEGLERVERHEKLDKWKARLRKAGFNALPLSYSTVMQAKTLLASYHCEGYRLNEGSGCLTLAWQETPLYAASAWHA